MLRALDGELPPPLDAALGEHLAHCAECRTRMDAIQSSAGTVTAAFLDDLERGTPALEEMRTRLRVTLVDQSAALDRSWRFHAARQMARVPGAALAASALLAIVWGSVLVRHAIESRRGAGATAPVEAGALPIPALTPGATAGVTAADLCDGRGPSKEDIAPAIRQAVLRDYGMEGLPDADYELDYLITPELGGSSDRRNLWPERYGARVWNARVKDELEQLLPTLVCRGAVDLATAQRDIAADWIAAYKKYFRTDRPVVRQARLVARD